MLYLSSGLAGSGVSVATITQFISQGFKSESTERRLAYLTQKHFELIGEIAETILPKTKSPGAKDVGVNWFIDRFVDNCFPRHLKRSFRIGLNNWDHKCEQRFGSSYIDLNAEKREWFIADIDALMTVESSDNELVDIYRRIKSMTLLGYFTSEQVMKTVLDFEPYPMAFKGDVPMTAETKYYVNNQVFGG